MAVCLLSLLDLNIAFIVPENQEFFCSALYCFLQAVGEQTGKGQIVIKKRA